MLAPALQDLGADVHVYDPDPNAPALRRVARAVSGSWRDVPRLQEFFDACDVVTYEFENVETEGLVQLSGLDKLLPSLGVLRTTQNRALEKEFLRSHGLPHVAFVDGTGTDGLAAAALDFGFPAILKTARGGYDGKGQWLLREPADVAKAAQELKGRASVLEEWIDLEIECSVIGCRSESGDVVFYGPIINHHSHHILDVSICPAESLPAAIQNQAREVTRMLMDQLAVVGLLCVEFFVTRDGRLLVNELAPRPHNSGHLTIEGHVTSQFEQHVRAICGLPMGSVEQLRPAAMSNLLGDLWSGGEPNWNAVSEFPAAKLHLYGKRDAKAGRKMGHITAIGNTTNAATEAVTGARSRLTESRTPH